MVLSTANRLARLILQAVLPARFPGLCRYLHRLILMLAFLPILVISQLVNWLALGLDEIVFPRYRRVRLQRPVFVLGVPRSGTTFMHRQLAANGECISFSTWECLLAPSICQRYFWTGLARIDRAIGRPCARLMSILERKLLARTSDVHPTGLFEPEEDFYCFMPLLSCFILILPFPDADWVWRMARFDTDLSERERAACLDWYHRCLQRHMYFHGEDQRLLSKNASFAGMAGSLAERYPDSNIVICERDIESVVRSQFRSLEGGMRFFAIAQDDAVFRERLLGCIEYYYSNLERVVATLEPNRVIRVPLQALADDAPAVIGNICRHFRLTPVRA